MGKQNFRCHLTPRDAFFLLISEGGCGGRWGTLGHIQIRFKKQVFEVRAERKLLHTPNIKSVAVSASKPL